MIWTIGHSSRSVESFLALLEDQGIEALADVRRYAGSRAHPHFNPGALERSLAGLGIDYVPFAELGGRRRPSPRSRNTVWRNLAFRGYADYMETSEFESGLARLVQAASSRRTAIMCSEAVWWRCHRALISDALRAAGIRVLHMMEGAKVTEHPYTSAARLVEGRLMYGAARP